jgi:alpha-tubulin suppressor-like RCC1 family protein
MDDTCAVTSTGGVKCWGRDFGSTPVDIAGLASGVAAVSVGTSHRCVITTAGGAKCWGDNTYGELGGGTLAYSAVPVDVQGLTSGVTAISAGWNHTCAITSAGVAKCWGDGWEGELGDNSTANSVAPVDVQNLPSTMAGVACGDAFSCGRESSGALTCWGEDSFGCLGDAYAAGTQSLVPVNVEYITDATKLITGTLHACAITSAGGLQCWGYGGYGALGNGNTSDMPVPVPVQGLSSGVVDVAAGLDDTCAVTSAGAVLCWGQNTYGQLGDNSTTQSLVPAAVQGLSSGFTTVSVGDSHACAVASTGAVWCWGYNANGQLGNSSTTPSLVPVLVTGT